MDEKVIDRIRGIVGDENVLSSAEDLIAHSFDASTARAEPGLVVFPRTTEQVSRVVSTARESGTPVVARGAGTNLSGGTVPLRGGIVIVLTRMNEILEIDIPNQRAVVQPGVVNQALQDALDPMGFFYAPDPASLRVSTLGGNVGENSGGPHCIRYGVTTDHVLGLVVVLSDGRVVRWGGKAVDPPGYDLVGLWVGSEGTLGIVTEITLRILPKPEGVKTLLAVYDDLDAAGRTVSSIIASGIIPSTLEMMDQVVMEAVEKRLRAGYPLEAEAVLIVELEGFPGELDEMSDRIVKICRRNGVGRIQVAADEQERQRLWAGRRGAFGAVGRLRPSYLVCDGTVPRTQLPGVLKRVREIGDRYRLLIGNVFHAGDGNLHPLILFDERDPKEADRVRRASREILEACVEAGGTISGEHGIGVEKLAEMSLVFTPEEGSLMLDVKTALDPDGILNPGKLISGEGT